MLVTPYAWVADADDTGRCEACEEDVRARAEVEHGSVRFAGQPGRGSSRRRRMSRSPRRNAVQIRGGVAEALGEWPPGLEVEPKIELERDV